MVDYNPANRMDDLLNNLEQPYLKVIDPEHAIRPKYAIEILCRQVERGIHVLKKVRNSETKDLKWIQNMGTLLWNTYREEAKKIDDFAKATSLSIKDYPIDVPADLLEVCSAYGVPVEESLLVPGDLLDGGVGDSTMSDISPYLGFELDPPKGPSF